MHQTRKGRQWYFGFNAHIGVNAKEGIVHSLVTTSANVADSTVLPDLLHGEERKAWGDGGYQGQTEAIREAAPKEQDITCRRTKFKQYPPEPASIHLLFTLRKIAPFSGTISSHVWPKANISIGPKLPGSISGRAHSLILTFPPVVHGAES